MTSDEMALQAAVRANPDDDLPRLVYADWLDEKARDVGSVPCLRCRGERVVEEPLDKHGRHWRDVECPACEGSGWMSPGFAERAEFIRVQCELAKLPEPEYKTIGPGPGGATAADYKWGRCWRCQIVLPNRCVYHRQKVQVDALVRPEWEQALRDALVFEWEYDRGFLRVTGDTGSWLKHGPAIVRQHPVSAVLLTDVNPSDGERFWYIRRRSRWEHRVQRDVVPDVFFVRLPWHADPGLYASVYWDTRNAALEAVSEGAIRWALATPLPGVQSAGSAGGENSGRAA